MKYNDFLKLSTINKYVPQMKKRGVSKVARSGRGFLTAYRRAKGTPNRLSDKWAQKRESFLARTMAQVKNARKKGKDPLWEKKDGKKIPTRRHLSLIAWAYSPHAGRL